MLNIDLSEIKQYLFSLRYYILIAGLIFILGIVMGYFSGKMMPQQSKELISQLQETFEPILEKGPLSQILFIFLQNGLAAFLIILGGVLFGFFPFLSLLSNGELLGLVGYFASLELGMTKLLGAVLPHGLIEISCILISGAIGLKIGRRVFKRVFKKQQGVKQELSSGLDLFLKVILIGLFLAAVVEVLVSPALLRFF